MHFVSVLCAECIGWVDGKSCLVNGTLTESKCRMIYLDLIVEINLRNDDI